MLAFAGQKVTLGLVAPCSLKPKLASMTDRENAELKNKQNSGFSNALISYMNRVSLVP